MAKRKKKFSKALTIFLCITTLLAGCAFGVIGAAVYLTMDTHEQ